MYGDIALYTPDTMYNKVEEYFSFIDEYNRVNPPTKFKKAKPYTMAGLARYLGFTSAAQLRYYKNDENPLFEEVVNYAKLRIEESYEEALLMTTGPSTGIQFALKNNCGWDEKARQKDTEKADRQLTFMWDEDAKDVIDANPDVNRIEAPKTTMLETTSRLGTEEDMSIINVEVVK